MCTWNFAGGPINQPKCHCLLGTGSVPLDRLNAKSMPISAQRDESSREHTLTKQRWQGRARDLVPISPVKFTLSECGPVRRVRIWLKANG